MASLATDSRIDGKGYIDDDGRIRGSVDAPGSPVLSGSSVSEETDDEGHVQPRPRPTLHDDLLANLPILEGDDSDPDELDISELELDEEDWDLVDGDFTKQYNRMRQAREVLQNAQGARPLPARNATAAYSANAEAGPSRAAKSSVQSGTGITHNPKAQERKIKDKSDRATTEQVLDQRTRKTLQALTSRGVIGPITRCVSTGKEANVYHSHRAESPPAPYPESLAVKIYRTSILGFRSRQEYMQGEHRFRGEYTSSKNPRKMVKLWAEKEFRNLRRLEEEHIRGPRAMECKENVLVLEFLGDGLEAAPRLKDAVIDPEDLPQLYAELLVTVRRMFHFGKLVHADLSEYNILYHQSHLYIIDVSQSVEHDHPRAFDFLRIDLQNIEDYFTKRSSGAVRTLGLRRAYGFVTEDLEAHNEEELLEIVHQRIEEDGQDDADDAFLHTFIPRALAEIRDPEKVISDGGLDQQSGVGQLVVEGTRDIRSSTDCGAPENDIGEVVDVSSGDEDILDSCSEDEQLEREPGKPTPQNRGFRHEDREEKKARKQAVKDQNREKRKHKMPKAQKQKLVKKTAR